MFHGDGLNEEDGVIKTVVQQILSDLQDSSCTASQINKICSCSGYQNNAVMLATSSRVSEVETLRNICMFAYLIFNGNVFRYYRSS